MGAHQDIEQWSYEVGRFRFRIMSSEEEVRQAEMLLHDVYLEEQNWVFRAANPSGLKTSASACGNRLLTDDYSGVAHWFGAFDGGNLIGCFRVLEHPHCELSGYLTVPAWLEEASPCELNRLAIRPEYRNHRFVMLMLKRAAFDFAFSLSHTVYVTAEYPRLSELYEKMGLIATGVRFKYEKNDEYPVELLYFNAESCDRFDTSLYRLSGRFVRG